MFYRPDRAKAEFTIATAATLTITFYENTNNVKVYVNGTEVEKNTDGTYTLTAGKVSIEAQSSGYIGKEFKWWMSGYDRILE